MLLVTFFSFTNSSMERGWQRFYMQWVIKAKIINIWCMNIKEKWVWLMYLWTNMQHDLSPEILVTHEFFVLYCGNLKISLKHCTQEERYEGFPFKYMYMTHDFFEKLSLKRDHFPPLLPSQIIQYFSIKRNL